MIFPKKQIPGMIGTSILTVYQGHISEASLRSSTDFGRLRRSLVCMNLQTSEMNCPMSSLLFWDLSWFSFLSSTETNLATFVKTLIMFWNVLVSACLGLLPVDCVVLFLCSLVSYLIYCVTLLWNVKCCDVEHND